MNRLERDDLLQRYLAGWMSGPEEEEFFIKVALDRELRGELQAHRAIDSAIRKEVSGQPGRHSAARQKSMAMLAAMPAPARKPSAPSPRGGSVWWGVAGLAIVLALSVLFIRPSTDKTARQPVMAPPETMLPAAITNIVPTLDPPRLIDRSPDGPARSLSTNDRPVRRSASMKRTSSGAPQGSNTPATSSTADRDRDIRVSRQDRADDSVPVRIHVRIGGEKEKNDEVE